MSLAKFPRIFAGLSDWSARPRMGSARSAHAASPNIGASMTPNASPQTATVHHNESRGAQRI